MTDTIIRIASTEYDEERNAFVVFLSGCKPPHCTGCHNEPLWDFNIGTNWRCVRIDIPDYVKRIFIMGGEPLDQSKIELITFCNSLHRRYPDKEYWLWTRYYDIPEDVECLFNYVKSGPYKEGLPERHYEEFNITLASNNQEIRRVNGS